jgi:CheY-like chemotaxis protein
MADIISKEAGMDANKPSSRIPRLPPGDKPVKTARVLVADDNPVNQQIASTLLATAGYSCDIAISGREAINTYTADPDGYDIILMDVQMPEMDGIQATREIRRWEKRVGDTKNNATVSRRVPIFAMTGFTDHEKGLECLAAGMDDVFRKPIRWATLFQKIAEILNY